ncbi:MAG: MATE family efflux transporter [Oscillospiraceae bacterium]|nr:MATE family efflux transporter [Oscillospiraceae bacterium]
MDFTKGKITRQIVLFTLPLLLGNLCQQLYSVADAIIVGRYISGGTLAAVGSSTAIIGFLNGSLLGLTIGAAVVISHCYGASEQQRLRRTFTTSVIFLVIVSLCLSVLGFILSPVLLRLLSTPVEIFDYAVRYLRLSIIGLVFQAIFNMYSSYMRALGDSKHPLYLLICASLLNILLDYAFVAWFNLGVAGVALATIVSNVFAVLLSILLVRRQIPLLKVEVLVFDKESFPAILRNSLPAAIQMTGTSLISLLITRLANSFGELAAAGYSAAIRLDSFALLLLESLSLTMATFAGQNIGAGNVLRAKKGYRNILIMMLTIALCASAFVLLFGKQILGIFVSQQDPNSGRIVSYGWEFLATIGMFYVLHALFFSFNGFFRGTGDATIVMILTISSLSIRVICSYLFAATIVSGPAAIGYSIPIGWAICGTIACIYYRKGKYLKHSV